MREKNMKISPVSLYCVNNLKHARKNNNNLKSVSPATPTPTRNISFGMAKIDLGSLFSTPTSTFEECGGYDELGACDDSTGRLKLYQCADEEFLILLQRLANDNTATDKLKRDIIESGAFCERLKDENEALRSDGFINAFIDICPSDTLRNMLLLKVQNDAKLPVDYADSRALKTILDKVSKKDEALANDVIKAVLYRKAEDENSNLKKIQVALDKFKEMHPDNQTAVNDLLGKNGDLWFPKPHLAKTFPKRWNVACETFGMKDIDFNAEEQKFYKRKIENLLNEIRTNKQPCHMMQVNDLYDRMDEEEKNKLIQMLDYKDIYDSYDSCFVSNSLCNIIPAAKIVKYSSDKSKAVKELITSREFNHYKNNSGTDIKRSYNCSPLSKTLEKEGVTGIFEILKTLEDYPRLQYEILTSKIVHGETVNEIPTDCDVRRYEKLGDGRYYIESEKSLEQCCDFGPRGIEDSLKKYIEGVYNDDEITDEEALELAFIYTKELARYYARINFARQQEAYGIKPKNTSY